MLNQSPSYQSLRHFQQSSIEFSTQTTPFELDQTYREWLVQNPNGLEDVATEIQTGSALFPATAAYMPC